MTASSPQTLLLGDAAAAEMAPVLATVVGKIPVECVRRASNVHVARTLVEQEGWFPDLIVVCQNWPDEYSSGDVHELLALCPLARIVCCFGVWCDSDGRTRSTWTLAVRVPATMAAGRIERELELLDAAAARRTASIAALPLTASRREIFDFDFPGPSALDQFLLPSHNKTQGTQNDGDRPHEYVAVISPDTAWRRMMEAALIATGYCPHGRVDTTAPEAIVCDADPWSTRQSERLHALHEQYPQATCIAFLGFPRPELIAEVQAAGADCVYHKLAPLAAWLGQLKTGNLFPEQR